MKQYKNVTIMDHPLIRHKIALLRDEETCTKQFRELIEEITSLVAYEALRDVPTKKKLVKTPLETCEQDVVPESSIALVPILRAGLGMVNGVLTILPTAKVGHIGMYRDEETLQPKEYYCKLPDNIQNMVSVILDPMLATGGSASAAMQYLKNIGCAKIKLMSVIAAPEGIKRVAEDHPDVEVFVACLDRCLNENGYILPGLGDAGDRLFGTKQK